MLLRLKQMRLNIQSSQRALSLTRISHLAAKFILEVKAVNEEYEQAENISEIIRLDKNRYDKSAGE